MLQVSIIIIWALEFIEVTESDEKLKREVFNEVLSDYNLHVMPMAFLGIEFMVNS